MNGKIGEVSVETILAFGAPIVIALIVLESVIALYLKRDYYKRYDSLGTLGMLAGNGAMNLLTKTSVFLLYLSLYEYRLFSFSETLPLWLVIIISLFIIDFTFYCFHRFSHRVRFMWAIHMNHHSSEEMNFLVSLRQAWFGPIAKIPFFAIPPLLGLDPSIMVVTGMAATLWGVISHTKFIPPLGPIEWFFNTPSAHRVHHGTNSAYIDKNFGNMFIIWDRLLGTYAAEKEEVSYGLVTQIGTNNPLTITFATWKNIISDIKQSNSFSDSLGYFFGPPEWQPKEKQT